MEQVKQVIVMRSDLGMRKGKMIAQGAHASMGALLRFFDITKTPSVEEGGGITSYSVSFQEDSVLGQWLGGVFTKICLRVDSEEELLSLEAKCQEAGIPCALIVDSGLTEFHGHRTVTCLGIGPWNSAEIDKVTGDLKLF